MKILTRLYITVFIISSVILIGCTSKGNNEVNTIAQERINISGRINYPLEKRFFIETLNSSASGFIPYDTVALAEDNTFNHFVVLNSPGYYRLNLSNRQMINVILNKDDLHIIADGNEAQGFVEIDGSTELEQIKAFNSFLETEFVSRENDLSKQFTQARQSQDTETATKIQEQYTQLLADKEVAIMQQIDQMGSSLAVIQALNFINKDENFAFYEKIANNLLAEYPNEPNIRNMQIEVEKLRYLSIGQPAPEIELPNPEGELIKLSSFKGKVVLVDFWAEWCKPCRLENPNVVRAYKKYNSKGFEVFGVSLDRTKEKWLKAIKDDGLVWTHVSDLKFWQSAAAQTYNVSAIPMSFLLDRNGIIIGKNLRGAALDKRLEELFAED